MIFVTEKLTKFRFIRFGERPNAIARWVLFALLGFISLGFIQGTPSDWQTPSNLSASGSASRPTVVVDSEGITRIIWVNENINSFVYLWGGPNSWSGSRPAELPFGTRQYFPDLDETDPTPLFTPTLVADTRGDVHAFWLDNEQNLLYSWVRAANFGSFSAWNRPEQLAEGVTAISAAVDQNGAVHISYIQTQPNDVFEEGVYYRRQPSRFAIWSQPDLLYASPYYQLLPGDQASTHLAVDTGALVTNVYLTWDNSPREELFFSRSVDGGFSWEEPILVDSRQDDDGPDSVGPSNILIEATGDKVIMLWQAGHELSNCDQYYQLSNDAGETWQTRTVILDDLTGCPQGIRFLGLAGEVSLFSFFYQDQPYLLAWQDGQWSEPQVQRELTTMTSPDTFRRISLGCHQLALLDEAQLLALACGTGQSDHTADIWQSSRFVGDVEMWFPPEPVWQTPTEVIPEAMNLIGPVMASDSLGKLHVIWSQLNESSATQSSIFYSTWDDGQWSQSIPVLDSPEGSVGQVEVGITRDDQILVTWVSSSGELYFSQASADRALIRSEWAPVLTLPTPGSVLTGADIALSADGVCYIAYSVAINDSRGVYLIQSTGGKDWSEPILALDGVQQGWQIVGAPRIVVTNDGALHLLLTEEVPQSGRQSWSPAALYYARSNGFNEEFSQPELVSEVPTGWVELLSDNQGRLHQVWQESTGSAIETHHAYSLDSGYTWTGSTRVGSQNKMIGVAIDSGGQLHALLVSDGELEHRSWEGSTWHLYDESDPFQFETDVIDLPLRVSGVITSEDLLATLYSNQIMAPGFSDPLATAYFTWREIEPPADIELPISTPNTGQDLAGIDSLGEDSTIPGTTTPDVATLSEENNALQEPSDSGEEALLPFLNTDNETMRLVFSLVPVALFLLGIFGVGLWMFRRFR